MDFLEEDIYMQILEGQQIKSITFLVYKVEKSFYGLH